MDGTFYVVWNPSRGNPMFRHPNIDSAKKEAERLAQQNSGQEFFVLRAMSRSVKKDVWTENLVERDGYGEQIPF